MRSSSIKKLLFVSHSSRIEGGPLYLVKLAKGLAKKGYEISFILSEEGPLEEIYSKDQIPYRVVNYFADEFELQEEADLFFANTILSYKFIEKLSPEQRKKVVWILHESEKDTYFKQYPDLDPTLFSQVAKVIFVAETTRAVYEDLNTSQNFETIHNGFDLDAAEVQLRTIDRLTLKRSLGFDSEDIIVLIVGTVSPRKGQLEFVEAAIKICDDLQKTNLKFVIVGAGLFTAYEEEIVKLIAIHQLEKQILLLTSRPSFDYFAICDVYVCNSYIESFPVVTFEAMAVHAPIVSTDVYGLSEQITNGKEGLLVAAGDTVALTKSIVQMLEDASLRTSLANNAYKKLQTQFTFSVMIDKFVALIEKLNI